MKLPEIGVKQPIFTAVIFVVILLLGAFSYYKIPIDMMPEIEQPTISVITPYLGVGAEDIETLVTKRIENSISGAADLEEISSMSKDNISVVTLKFQWGADLNEAMDELRLKLEMATRELPNDIDPPQLFKFNTAQWPVVFYGVTAEESWADLKTLVENRMADQLKTIPGVGTVRLIAGLKREIKVEVDLEKLKGFEGVSINSIQQAIAAENLTLPVGDMTIGQKNMTIRLPAEFKQVKEIEDVIIGMGPTGGVIKVKDIATVIDGFEKQSERVFFNGKPGIMMMVMKQTGGNTVQVVGEVNKRLDELIKTMPADVKIVKLYDMSQFIKDAVNNLKRTILIGGLLVIFVVYAFLRNVRSSLIVGATIPYSLILAFIFMYFMGYTINMMSLASLAVAIGMVVDNAIVVFENITRHMEEGQKLNKASVAGASEVGLAVSSSTLTTVVIFLPLLYVSGLSGIMFRQLGFVVTVTLLGSLFASLTLTPMMASKLLRGGRKTGYVLDGSKTGFFKTLENAYARLLDIALKNQGKTLMVAIGIFLLLSIGLKYFTKVEFMPDEDTGDIRIFVEYQPGADVNHVIKDGVHIMETMMEKFVGTNGKKEWDALFMRGGQSISGFGSAVGEKEGDNVIMLGGRFIKREERTRSTFDYAEIIRPELAKIPGVMKMDINAGNMMQTFFGGGKPIVIEIKGADFHVTNDYANKIASRIRELEGTRDVTVSRDAGRINLSLNIDRERMNMMGLKTATAAAQLRTAIFGSSAGKYRVGDDEYDIMLQLKESDRNTLESLRTIPMLNFMNRHVTLGNIIDIREDTTPIQIDRLDQERVVKVEANTVSGADLGKLTTSIKGILKDLPSPDPKTISVHMGGNLERMSDSFRDLAIVALMGLILVYVVMAAQFENLVDPFIIMFSVPFALNGVLLFIIITGISFTMYTFLGIIMLIGTVVNNAIVFVDYTNILRRHGKTMDEALRVAGTHRLRPILMTTITTVFGMIPMALSRAEGAEMWRPLGISVIGGLSFATLVTLVLIPVVYHIVYTQLMKRGRGQREEIVID